MKILPLFILLFLVSCSNDIDRTLPSQNNDENTNNENAINILFIGNSLTLSNSGIDFHVAIGYCKINSVCFFNKVQRVEMFNSYFYK